MTDHSSFEFRKQAVAFRISKRLTTEKTAKHFGVTARTIYRWAAEVKAHSEREANERRTRQSRRTY